MGKRKTIATKHLSAYVYALSDKANLDYLRELGFPDHFLEKQGVNVGIIDAAAADVRAAMAEDEHLKFVLELAVSGVPRKPFPDHEDHQRIFLMKAKEGLQYGQIQRKTGIKKSTAQRQYRRQNEKINRWFAAMDELAEAAAQLSQLWEKHFGKKLG